MSIRNGGISVQVRPSLRRNVDERLGRRRLAQTPDRVKRQLEHHHDRHPPAGFRSSCVTDARGGDRDGIELGGPSGIVRSIDQNSENCSLHAIRGVYG